MASDSLETRIGLVSEPGRRSTNEDYVATCHGNGAVLRDTLAVIADGMGGGSGGRLAAETTVRGFIDGYLGLPLTLGVDRAAARALTAMNRWVHAQGQRDPTQAPMATTFTALILRGREAHVVHVGDTRVYRLRDHRLQRLTYDHTHSHPDMRHVLHRAVGLEDTVRADYTRHELRPHDRYLLCSDGVHGTLTDQRLQAILDERATPEEGARRIIESALEAGSHDNATALIVDIIGLPAADHAELATAMEALPIRELPRPDDVVDGFRLLEVISDGRYSRLFRAEDTVEAREVILKFPHPRVATETTYRRAFTREAWVASQVRSPFVTEMLELSPGRQTRLYAVLPFYRGESLEARLRRAPPLKLEEGVDIGLKLGRAIYALHRLRIIHRDVKPENVMLVQDGKTARGLRLLDLGVARLPGIEASAGEDIPGTPSYMAPELFAGAVGDERSDVYAFGVTLYRLFSGGHYPYGEIEAFSHPRFGKRVPLSRYRPDLPAWLDALLARATAVEPAERYADAMELAFDLENALVHGAKTVVRRQSLYERNPVRFWQIISLLLLFALIVVLAAR
ncbi:MAG: bifunctional protein-serine/threonine kinase/phosphatase [Gammaproteobacteria bacterium]|nr:bifunctional protein-serine/threonine kinase/phosphatase [Gammaproteobacteria bacterium]